MPRFALAPLCGLLFATASLASVESKDGAAIFRTDVKLAPGHYIDRDTGLDCADAGIVTACQPPDGTVRFFDPAQGAVCTRSGAAVRCSN